MRYTTKRAAIPEKAFTNSAALWKALQQYGDIEPSGRDFEFIPAIREYLRLPSTGSFANQLRAEPVPLEKLVEAVFSVTAPYGRMLSDLMVFFERAGASASEDNISVVFNFDAELEPLKFDLRSFRQLQTVLRPSVAAVERLAWNHDSARDIRDLLSAATPPDTAALPNGVSDWLNQYHTKQTWPREEPPPTIFGLDRLNTVARELWLLWTGVVTASRRVGRSRRALQRTRFTPAGMDTATGKTTPPDPLLDQAWLLAALDREEWAGTFLRSLAVLSVSPRAWPLAETTLVPFVETLPRTRADLAAQIHALVDVLNLPIWQRRSELYSAWVGSVIVAAFGDNVRIHTEGNKIVFSFSGSHLATARISGQNVHIWAELRSRWTGLAAPRSKKRTKAIQPDYTVTVEPVTDPASSVLVVEVKHYLKASGSNFASALQDYAMGRPRACVVLVDYGKAGRKIIDAVAPAVKNRCQLFEEFHPFNDTALTQFSRTVRETISTACVDVGPSPGQTLAVTSNAPSPLAARNEAVPAAAGSTIELRWRCGPADLDLHVWLVQAGETSYVSYRQKTTSAPGIVAELESDCRTAPGYERFSVNSLPDYLRCAVHNYSGHPSLSDANATVAFTAGAYRFEVVAPAAGSGRWWVALEFWSDSGRVLTSNSLIETIPDPSGPVSTPQQRAVE